MQRQYRKLATAVRDFQRAARAVAGAWESVGDGGAVSHYPSWMPSFDEAVSDLLDMQVVVPEPDRKSVV